MAVDFSGIRRVIPPVNEPIRSYAPGSPEKASLKARLASMAAEQIDIPLIIGGKEIRTGDLGQAVMPHKHKHVLATYHHARPKDVTAAIAAAQAAKAEWASWSWEDRAAVFLKAADLLATTWRDTLNAATMLNQSKTVYQSEIDAACELIDFWRFNVAFAADMHARAAGVDDARCGTRPTTGRSKASSTRCRRSTSRPSAATSRPRPR